MPNSERKAESLHILKDKLKDKTLMGVHSDYVRLNWKEIHDCTIAASPKRIQGFLLDRTPTDKASIEERILAKSMYQRWNRPEMQTKKGKLDRIVAEQVPLFDNQKRGKWGHIDLLGVNKSSPVVIELKRKPPAKHNGVTTASETPLRMMLEGLAYAVALKKSDEFWIEWKQLLKVLKMPSCNGKHVSVICAAPASFWIDWLPITDKGKEFDETARGQFQELIKTVQEGQDGIAVNFASVSGCEHDPKGMAIQWLEPFPMT
jgi:hypothetical protein